MQIENHPMVPTNELLSNWEDQWFSQEQNVDVLLIEAYQAGADAELEAYCEWFKKFYSMETWMERDLRELLSARRPKPPSLKKQALTELAGAVAGGNITPERGAIIRLALEQLND